MIAAPPEAAERLPMPQRNRKYPDWRKVEYNSDGSARYGGQQRDRP
jgi:hypothetical protein